MTNTRKILIVDDDAELRDAMVEQLALHEEFESVAVDSGSKGVQAAKSGQVDLVIMDVGLPDLDGREAVRILRKNGFKAPIIMLTGHNTDSETILGLESGANDYVAKPFRFAVLLARIRAQLRQHEASEDAVFTIGPYTFRPSSKILLNQKSYKVRLTEKETAILRYLYRAGQRPVSRETLLQEVWGYNSGVTTHTLETHISLHPLPPSWSPRQAATSWCPNSKARRRRFGPSVTAKPAYSGFGRGCYSNMEQFASRRAKSSISGGCPFRKFHPAWDSRLRRGITLAGIFLAGAGTRLRYGARMMPQCSQWLCWRAI